MEYALVEGIRTLPAKGLRGVCPACLKDVVAKCGAIKVHHWAHSAKIDCDSWQELETVWHREWKKQFPESYHEVIFTDPETGEIHRADIYTDSGVTIEFQNSPISLEELKSREKFYKNLTWVVNAAKFKKFEWGSSLPDPESPELDPFEFWDSLHPMMYLKAEVTEKSYELLRMYSPGGFGSENIKVKNDLLRFRYEGIHAVWYASEVPIFLDFGHDFLYRLKKRIQSRRPLWYIQVVKKKDFIDQYRDG